MDMMWMDVCRWLNAPQAITSLNIIKDFLFHERTIHTKQFH